MPVDGSHCLPYRRQDEWTPCYCAEGTSRCEHGTAPRSCLGFICIRCPSELWSRGQDGGTPGVALLMLQGEEGESRGDLWGMDATLRL